MGNAGPFDFDLSDMDLSLLPFVKDQTMCESHSWTFPFLSPVTAAVLAVPVAAAAASVAVAASVLAVVLESVEVASPASEKILVISKTLCENFMCSVGGSSGRGVGSGGSKGGSINNSIEGRGSVVVVVVVVADPPPDLDSDSDSDDKFFDALSNSHCVKCQIEYLGSHFDHCDLDLESGQSSNDSKVG